MIRLSQVTKTYGARTLFKNLSFHFPENARVALIGSNGAGKTTLLNIICGYEDKDDGDIICPKNVTLGYLPQYPNTHPADNILQECMNGAIEVTHLLQEKERCLSDMAENFTSDLYEEFEQIESRIVELEGYKLEAMAEEFLLGFGFKPEQLEQPVTSLSGGWRMRLELARILINQPSVLILDEPTNHLDLPSIKWFEKYLQTFRGTVIFVSHDLDLLNHLATHILHLRNGKIDSYVGNYNQFLDAFELKQEQGSNALKHLKQRYDQVESFVNKFRGKASKAKQVQSRLKMLARMRMVEDSIEVEEMDRALPLEIPLKQRSGIEVLKIENASIGYEQPLLKKFNLKLNRGEKLAIIGTNGKGKSTLIKTIAGKINLLEGTLHFGHNVQIGYVPQEPDEILDFKRTMLENVQSYSPQASQFEVRRLLGSVGLSGDNVFKPISILSGGERNRTALCCILIQNPNVLVLDEPTNHLDLSMVEVLANALEEFEGTVIFVSHNRSFNETVASRTLEL